jgi:hypothetical protein
VLVLRCGIIGRGWLLLLPWPWRCCCCVAAPCRPCGRAPWLRLCCYAAALAASQLAAAALLLAGFFILYVRSDCHRYEYSRTEYTTVDI